MSLPKNESIDKLFRSILSLDSLEECYLYFEDLCTVKEILAMAQRLEVARMLANGESYQKVTDDTGVSSATVGRVKRCLDYGSGGYRMILDREDAAE
ncbi:MAG: hypothetical protein IJP11_04335 [Oscillospiraceae bacterium]|nr:hypothetical protein [Oscillospiraceae bacterium]